MTISIEWIQRFLISASITVLVAAFMALVSGCSVYKSSGRDSFESRAPGQPPNKTHSASIFENEKTEDTCWTQPSRDPLWDLPENSEVRVHALSNELIEVCLVPEN